MRGFSLLLLCSLACSAAARSTQHVGKKLADRTPPRPKHGYPMQPGQQVKRETTTLIPQTVNTTSK